MIKFDKSVDNGTIDHPRLTIIDFDFLMNSHEYVPKLFDLPIFTSYNKPPESIYYKYGTLEKTTNSYIRHMFIDHMEVWAYRLKINKPKTDPEWKEYGKSCMTHYNEAHNANKPMIDNNTYTFEKNTLPYIDNFGLGFALLKLIHTIYKEIPEGPLKQTVELLTSISDLRIANRTNPEDAYDRMKGICDSIRNNVSSGGRRTRRTRRTRHKRNRRTYKN
jgi:hypothetical protein